MLTQAAIENYRGFKSFRLEGLSTVNLFVGKNNSGKTALLESVHFLASGGDPTVLVNAASRRGEVVFGSREGPGLLDISHFFHGHNIRPGSEFSISGTNGFPPVTVKAVTLDEVEASPDLFGSAHAIRPAFAMEIRGGRPKSKKGSTFFLSEDGAVLVDPRRPTWSFVGDERGEEPPIAFISPDSEAPLSLGRMWNLILRDKQEGEVRKAMKILEDDLEDIAFQTVEFAHRSYAGRAGVLVSFKGDQKRVPLGSMGDGMRRLLALSISLIHAKGGYLIVDEIDTGFHYSIMAKMWELVVQTATESGIQVFATTHSSDCIRGLGVLCKRNAALRDKVAVHKIERNMQKNVAFSGADILDAVEQDIEMR